MSTWWQLGQLNLTAFVPGRMGLLHDVQWESENPSVIVVSQADFR